jgi:histidinol-phosphate aminotransferase
MINQINNFENLIIMRTLSKAFALAGARCGALIGSQRTIELLKKVVMPFTFSTVISQKIIQILSSNYREKTENHIQQIINERERVISTLKQLENVEKIWPSSANFFLVRFKDTIPVYNTFKENHILVRAFQDEPELKNCARITIGTHDENNILLDAIKHS